MPCLPCGCCPFRLILERGSSDVCLQRRPPRRTLSSLTSGGKTLPTSALTGASHCWRCMTRPRRLGKVWQVTILLLAVPTTNPSQSHLSCVPCLLVTCCSAAADVHLEHSLPPLHATRTSCSVCRYLVPLTCCLLLLIASFPPPPPQPPPPPPLSMLTVPL